MGLVKLNAAGGGEVAVRGESVFAILPDADTPADDAEIWWDALRSAAIAEPVAKVAAKLGRFASVQAASIAAERLFVNPALVTAVIPHPQKPGVCFLQGAVRNIAVKGTLDELLALLAA